MESTYKNTLQDYQNSLLEAINVLSKANDNKNVQTITVEAVIESVDDAAQGIYTVNYMGNVFKAYATGSSYQKEQQVYVLVPNGDFTKKKIIISAVGVNTLSQIQEDNSGYIFTSDNIIFDGDIPYSLCSYQNEHYVWNALSEDNKILFYKYSQKQRVFQLSCDIKTKLSPQQIDKRGYYYLTFTYATIMGGVSTPHQITLSVSNILGNPYQLNDWSNQKIIFKLDENEEVDKDFMPTLTLGCNNFIQNNSKTEKDIFFKNFTLQSLEDASLVKGYKLYLTADKGTYMRPPQVTSIKLVPELRYNGTIVDLTDAECFWFEQDAAITVEDEKFLSYGGPGWACLNQRKSEEDENGETFTYFVTDKYFSRIIMDTDIILNKFYKCIIIKENTTYSAEIEISQLNSDYALTVVADNKVYEKNAGNVVITASTNITPVYSEVLTFDWVRQDKNKKYISNDFYEIKKVVKNQQEVIAFPTRLVNEINYVVCSLRSSVRGLLASKTIAISVSEQLGYKLVIENGDVSYKYDASGKSPYLGAGYVSGSATAQPIAPLNLKIYKEDGKELNNDEYLSCDIKWRMPKEKTLLVKIDEPVEETDDYYIFSGMSLKYDIASYYNKSSVNNKIFLDIVFGDKTLSAVAQPHFLMDGALGTNGTKINTIIRYKGYAYNEIDGDGKHHRCKIIYGQDDNGRWNLFDEEGNALGYDGSIPFILDVYIEGEKVSENGNWIAGFSPKEVDTSCTWDVINAFPGMNGSNGEMESTLNLASSFNLRSFYWAVPIIKADIKYAGKIVSTYYPIDFICDSCQLGLDKLIQYDIEGGFDCILYNNVGMYPSYNRTPFIFKGPKEYENYIYNTYGCSHHFYTDDEEYEIEISQNKEFSLKVAESFFSSEINDYAGLEDSTLQIYLYPDKNSGNWFGYHRPILSMCNTYSLASMNDWDGLKVQINDDESIYSPIVGAGKKDGENKFSGFLMGDIVENGVPQSTRFTAYHKGIRTFNIDSKTGKVSIGAGNGQIIIDPDANGNVDGCKAVIKSGNYKTGTNGEGMEIDFTDPHIYFGSGKFKVNNQGKVIATDVDITGKITATSGEFNGKITAKEGSIGGWTINTGSLTAGKIILNSNGSISGGSSYAWEILTDGSATFNKLTAKNANIEGYIKATSGEIGGCTISNGKLSITQANISGDIVAKKVEAATGTLNNVIADNLTVNSGEIKLGGYILNAEKGLRPVSTAQFGNFSCDVNSIYSGGKWVEDKTPTVFMCTGSIGNAGYPDGQTIAGKTQKGWCFGAGGKFGVDVNGNVYCSSIKVTGTVTEDAQGNISSTSQIGLMQIAQDGSIIIPLPQESAKNHKISFGKHVINGTDYVFSIYQSGGADPKGVILGITMRGDVISNL